jgi:hypothetical protein
VIPPVIETDVTEIEALISDWRFEMMTTSWSGYWIVQLSQKGASPLAMLLNLKGLENFCAGLRECVKAAQSKLPKPAPQAMVILVSENLPTQSNDEGAIQIIADWGSKPSVSICFYRNRKVSGKEVIRQFLDASEAAEYLGYFERAYDRMPNKQSWVPK